MFNGYSGLGCNLQMHCLEDKARGRGGDGSMVKGSSLHFPPGPVSTNIPLISKFDLNTKNLKQNLTPQNANNAPHRFSLSLLVLTFKIYQGFFRQFLNPPHSQTLTPKVRHVLRECRGRVRAPIRRSTWSRFSRSDWTSELRETPSPTRRSRPIWLL